MNKKNTKTAQKTQNQQPKRQQYRRADTFDVRRPFGKLHQYEVVVSDGGSKVERFYYQSSFHGKQFFRLTTIHDGKNKIQNWTNISINVIEEKKEDLTDE